MIGSRRARSVSLSVLVALGFLLATAVAPPAAAQFTVAYVEPPADYLELVVALRDSAVFEEAAGFVGSVLDVPREVPIVFDSCGEPNAFYDREGKRIVYCYEFLGLFASLLSSDPELTEEELGEALIGSALFFLLHEMGHALVDVLGLPITGREEDAVDDLAALILIDAEAHDDLLSAADAFDHLAAAVAASGAQPAFWDEHSLNAQRSYSLACLVFGSDPDTYQGPVAPDLLPEQRAVRCPDEYLQKADSWDRLLEPYYVFDDEYGYEAEPERTAPW